MRFEEKLRKQMLLKGFNQQKLAKLSQVSDSEVSRILGGKSQPGLENALRLARAVEVSLDYLSDDELDDEPRPAAAEMDPNEREILDLAHQIGVRQTRRVLETAAELGYEVAIRRLLEMKPLIEVGDPSRQLGANVSAKDRRASSA